MECYMLQIQVYQKLGEYQLCLQDINDVLEYVNYMFAVKEYGNNNRNNNSQNINRKSSQLIQQAQY